MTLLSPKLVGYSVAALLVALLLTYSADEDLELAEKRVLLSKPQRECFAAVGDLEKFAEWYPGVAGYMEIETGPKTRGKRYRETVNVPFYGNLHYVHTLLTYDPPNTIEFMDDSWLQLKFKIWFYEEASHFDSPRTMMAIKITSRYRTYWFQYVAAPFFRFLYDQRLRSAAFNVRFLVDQY